MVKLKCEGSDHLPSTVCRAAFARFDSTRQFFASAELNNDEFPPFIQDLFDPLRNVDDLTGWNDFVIPVNIPVKHLYKVKVILHNPICVKIGNFTFVLDTGLAS